MKLAWLPLSLVPVLLAAPPGLSCGEGAKAPTVTRVSGPYTHANLAIYLLHGPDVVVGRKFLTLAEALEQKKVVVNETGQVNQLTVDNRSDGELFIMTGDIVKGGRQDRVLSFDLVVPPNSGAVPIPSFCVENGRWQGRGDENAVMFSACTNQAVGNDLKQAINYSRNQSEVWKKVAENQARLGSKVGKEVRNAASPTSLQLALEDKDLVDHIKAYEKDLADLLAKNPDAIGVAVVVNGRVSGADLFGSADLLRKLWPRLLRSAATEALGAFEKDKKVEAPAAAVVQGFLSAALAVEKQEEELTNAPRPAAQQQAANRPARAAQQQAQAANAAQPQQPAPTAQPAAAPPPPRVRIYRYDSAKALVVECQDRERAGLVLHRCFIAK
jgi:hypothetical protein